jgi:polygalacturonase
MSGTFSNTKVINAPAQGVSVQSPAPLVISRVTIDNCRRTNQMMNILPFSFHYVAQGDQPNSQSNGQPAGKNTDGFDCSTHDLTIEQSTIINQVQLTVLMFDSLINDCVVVG